VFLMCFKTNHV